MCALAMWDGLMGEWSPKVRGCRLQGKGNNENCLWQREEISLLALSLWSFHFASLCSFGLLAYVGYILYAFPSMFQLHHLNRMLLVFILFWAASTYIFNVSFTFFNNKSWKDIEIWETIGLWHYPIPGYYLLAQFGLGFLVAMCNLVNSSVLLCVTDQGQLTADESVMEGDRLDEEEGTTLLVVATIAWGLRKCSHVVVLILIFLIAIKSGFIHAVYSNNAFNCKLRQAIILLCEAQFALQFILQLDLISKTLDQEGSYAFQILSQLGLLNHIHSVDFFKISILACFCAIHNHGLQTLLSFSTIVRQTSCPPVGFNILRVFLIRPVCLLGYSPRSVEGQGTHERETVSYLEVIRQNFLSVYRLCGTYIAFLTILFSVYLCTPNYASFGYLFFLLLWISGRQLAGKTRKHLWYPMKVYAIVVFISIYSIGVFSSFEMWFLKIVDLQTAFGYNPAASILQNIWGSLAVLVVMQLYSYERRKSKRSRSSNYNGSEIGPQAFALRLLVRNAEKILSVALFYASLSPISAFGFLYLLGLINFSRLPKLSQIPSKVFLVYSGLLVMVEYLFQMWGDQAEMFPGQENFQISLFMGLQLYKPGFKGLESGLRGKVVVIVACIVQYNVFHWLEKRRVYGNGGKWNEPCPLFNLIEIPNETTSSTPQSKQWDNTTSPRLIKGGRSYSWPTVNSVLSQGPDSGLERDNAKNFQYFHFWESSKDSIKWNRKRILFLRKERMEMQKTVLTVSLKFWIENMFNLFGLEINMIALLLASFAVLNAISLLYIASLAACILLHRLLIRKLWPVFVFLFASIIVIEYLATWMRLTFTNQQIEEQVPCHDCWRVSDIYFSFCKKCWLGIIVDDPRMLMWYYGIFMFSCFKFRADQSSCLNGLEMYQKILSQWKSASVLSDLSFETKGYWTFLDHLRLYGYCHLLDFVLSLILITGTLEYDILHLGYLGFALLFFRIRLKILQEGNKIFRFLRMYNFVLIVMSLAYQSPFVGDFSDVRYGSIESITELVGFHKYDYGFRITSRSAFVEIIIFVLVALQSYMFSFPEFDYVPKYLVKEQIGAILRQQEKKAASKTAQLQHIRKAEELKHLRSLQVEKMKSEMLNLQNQLHNMSTEATCSNSSLEIHGLKERENSSLEFNEENGFRKQNLDITSESIGPFDGKQCLLSEKSKSPSRPQYWKHPMDSPDEILEIRNCYKLPVRRNVLVSALHFIGKGVSQVQSFGNMAVNNLMNYLKIEHGELESTDDSSEDEVYYDIEIENQNVGAEPLEPTISTHTIHEHTLPDAACHQIGIILSYMWSRMRSNNDVVCYCCFILIYLWNFSLFSVIYQAGLFLYALCQNTGPSYIFWVFMLIYTEVCILLQYLYQIIIQHTEVEFHVNLLQNLGFPAKKITSSFVTSNFPFFLVYICTLLQTSITVKDGGWTMTADLCYFKRRNQSYAGDVKCFTYQERLLRLFIPLKNILKRLIRSLCRYWKSLTRDAETPPYFVQLSMEVNSWPKEGIQPKKIESRINKLLNILHKRRCKEQNLFKLHSASRVHVQSIEKGEENENLCLVVFEVLYASPPIEFASEEWYSSLTPAGDVSNEIRKAQQAGIFKQIGFPYRILSVIGGGKKEIDLYAYIFGADLAVFFLISIFYESVMKANSEFLEVYQLEDQFPEDFVLVLMARKVIFYLFNLVLFTYSITKYAWDMDPLHRYSGRLALRAIYLTKAISLVLQAMQLHFGIPHKSTLYRQFLTSSVSRINVLGFRLYRVIPFLYELRCVLDWSCTRTSLTMYDWLKMYSSGNPTNIANPIKDASARVDIKTSSGRLTLFETTLCEKIPWEKLEARTSLDPHGYLSSYNEKDIQLICCQSDASKLWLVPPIVQARFIESLRWNMDITFSWEFIRDRPKGKEAVKYELGVQEQDLPTSSEVTEVFNGTSNSFAVFNIYPRYFRVTGSGDVRSLEQSVELVSADIVLNPGDPKWWSFYDFDILGTYGCGKFPGPMAIIVSEETPQGIIGDTLSKFSIWGLYITFVLAVGRFIRLQCSDLRMRIPFENLPYCDRLMAICEDIYAARAAGELEVEEHHYRTAPPPPPSSPTRVAPPLPLHLPHPPAPPPHLPHPPTSPHPLNLPHPPTSRRPSPPPPPPSPTRATPPPFLPHPPTPHPPPPPSSPTRAASPLPLHLLAHRAAAPSTSLTHPRAPHPLNLPHPPTSLPPPPPPHPPALAILLYLLTHPRRPSFLSSLTHPRSPPSMTPPTSIAQGQAPPLLPPPSTPKVALPPSSLRRLKIRSPSGKRHDEWQMSIHVCC
ncbi:hypothetical protein Fmac_007017 [Flemingia macrophylla]|uniref:Piezo non-specific cation channel R-Ras-binding domain-containing protein n=1 Tax=Flemingia macrophylla TaxID=520843 RepID=A0ABD1NC82_9FABA